MVIMVAMRQRRRLNVAFQGVFVLRHLKVRIFMPGILLLCVAEYSMCTLPLCCLNGRVKQFLDAGTLGESLGFHHRVSQVGRVCSVQTLGDSSSYQPDLPTPVPYVAISIISHRGAQVKQAPSRHERTFRLSRHRGDGSNS